jgi:hypothetical protein
MSPEYMNGKEVDFLTEFIYEEKTGDESADIYFKNTLVPLL